MYTDEGAHVVMHNMTEGDESAGVSPIVASPLI